jgi:hypothetical protein
MTATTDDPASGLRTTVARIHAICLFIITIGATIGTTMGWQGYGPFDLLASQPWGYIGLYQAYMLMFLLALVALIGTKRWPSRMWNAVLLAAHLAPVSIIVIANDVLVSTGTRGMAYLVALTVHIPLMSAEIFALLWGARWRRRSAAIRATTPT